MLMKQQVLYVLTLLTNRRQWSALAVDQRSTCLQRVFQAYLTELSDLQMPNPYACLRITAVLILGGPLLFSLVLS